jgi:hypothetical protein
MIVVLPKIMFQLHPNILGCTKKLLSNESGLRTLLIESTHQLVPIVKRSDVGGDHSERKIISTTWTLLLKTAVFPVGVSG